MGKRKRNSINPFKKDKQRTGKKSNPIYGSVGGSLKPKNSKKEVNRQNEALVEQLDRQLGEQQQLTATRPEKKEKPAEKKEKPAPPADEKSVDERVAELSESLMRS